MSDLDSANTSKPESYQVVARKYRPQTFEGLIGQGHIATALGNAIKQSRVGHAYLFTGARGVGKTSSARIFAKCLNCVAGPTTHPCNECDSCQAVSLGEDVDVLEIDGASNRGIDEIRSLRSNVAIRPSRARYKVYIIDEVHMLTSQAFNALLKTLEEPPKHVKFIFCTTDPHKIPITVLSRCQRYDFSPVQTHEIMESLQGIVTLEGKTADSQALNLLARRANGSMRDSQSLLEQIFSFCGSHISVDEVHQLLGTADLGRVAVLAEAMLAHDPSTSLGLVHVAMSEGIDPGQLASQLLGFFRDLMAVKLNCGVEALLICSGTDLPTLERLSQRMGIETTLSILQVLDASIVRMQSSLHARTLLEIAIIRICNLESLDVISDLVRQLTDGGLTQQAVRNVAVAASPPSPAAPPAAPPAAGDSKKNEIVEPITPVSSPVEPANTKTVEPRQDPAHKLPADPEMIRKMESIEHNRDRSKLVLSASSASAAQFQAASPTATSSPAALDSIAPPQKSPSMPAAVASRSAASPPPQTRTVEPVWNDCLINASEIDDEIEIRGEDAELPEVDVEESLLLKRSAAVGYLDLTNPQTLQTCWHELIESLQGITADMVGDPERLEFVSPNLIRATTMNAYTVRECLKSDRKQAIESALSKICRQPIRVDFVASERVSNRIESSPPQLPRAQQLRMLLERDFVKQAIEVFNAEIASFYSPAKTD